MLSILRRVFCNPLAVFLWLSFLGQSSVGLEAPFLTRPDQLNELNAHNLSLTYSCTSNNSRFSPLENELTCLACNIYHEARGETFHDRELVAYVTLNRLYNWLNYPRGTERYASLCSVVWSGQFDWTSDAISNAMSSRDGLLRSLSVARYVLFRYHATGVIRGEQNATAKHRADHYHAASLPAQWPFVTFGRVGGHSYYYSGPTGPPDYGRNRDVLTQENFANWISDEFANMTAANQRDWAVYYQQQIPDPPSNW